MAIGRTLERIADRHAFPPVGAAERRWGLLLRESIQSRTLLANARREGRLVPLGALADVHSGVVPRANAYFLVRELPFDEIPARFHITKRDYQRVTVIEDGLKALHRCERVCLRTAIKGPEGLLGPTHILETDQRLFDVGERTKEELRELRANGALSYLRRGETVYYKVSDDSLKGGIPAQRSNVRNRQPFWYSLHSPSSSLPRLAVPEHADNRFVATLLPSGQDAVVIDTLYSITPRDGQYAALILASLNSLLVWHQLEMRGRTQHGEGVLKVKLADWKQLLVLDPRRLTAAEITNLLQQFEPLQGRDTLTLDHELHDPERLEFDTSVFRLCATDDAEMARTQFERELRAAVDERHERASSMDEAKAGRAATRRVTASADAYAARIAAELEPFPDPRTFLEGTEDSDLILVAGPIAGRLTLGEDLFTQGRVFAGGETVASAGDIRNAQFVRAVLLHDPELTAVAVPREPRLSAIMAEWEQRVVDWQTAFDNQASRILATLADQRLTKEVAARARVLLHAE